ncbi:hypothetical protein [Hoeflea ulvae]|uniref:Uncharacterized protein n=1 Tax=Hoeflea ulvae TaxID=2983764 RepID=A0ABT3YM18_9HYPH|nr:hypothetical protein [Hoeflea ulvae]MCY0096921.1 hypothetical protein [Hoeflea ulvae]
MTEQKKGKTQAETIHKDAEGQFARPKKHSTNNGVASATPRVITGSDDATTEKPAGGDWKLHHDEHENNEGEFRG